jgi:pyridoxal phosphate enzyme (YggS family)
MVSKHSGLSAVRKRIEAAALGRPVTLVAVSKTFGAEQILPVIGAGQQVFGENRVQEAKAKWPALKQQFSGLELHLIGPLQTNKAADAVALFDCIQTLDRPKLARILAEEMQRQNRHLILFVQVNTGHEPQKAGVMPEQAASFLEQCSRKFGLTISGLMCIPPEDQDPVPHFKLLKQIAGEAGLAQLSMGMSGDFETAIREGATHVRIGSAIFGARSYSA